MTRTEILPRIPSANDAFKRNYPRVLRWSVLVALALLCLIAWLMPRYEPTPYKLREDYIEIIDILVEAPPDMKDEQPIPAPPIVREIEPVPELDPGAAEPPDFRWPIDPPAPRYTYSEPGEAFVASSAKPRLTFQAKPKYPQIARMSGLEGTVVVKVLVGPGGSVLAAVVTQSIHPLLDAEAMKAAHRCRFDPGTQRSVPVKAWVEVPYRFRLH